MQQKFIPPMREGVSPSVIYLEKIHQMAKSFGVFEFLCQNFPHVGANEWRRRFDTGLVFWDDGSHVRIGELYEHGRSIYYYRFLDDEVVVPFEHEIIFENQDLMVVDKPHFLAVTPAGNYVKQTLLTRLKQQTDNANLSPIHRLDRETAGLILISKNPKTRGLYQSLFASHAIAKVYHAIAPAMPDVALPSDVRLHLARGEPFYTMQVLDKPANTHTHIRRIATQGDWAKYELHPTTGKLHQLRVHLNHLGAPIKNDPYYPVVRHKAPDDFTKPLQLLAHSLSFTDPITTQTMTFYSKCCLDF